MKEMGTKNIFLLKLTLVVFSFLETALADSACIAQFGTCQYTTTTCSGTFKTGLCDGPTNRQCCIPNFNDVQCSAQSGVCQNADLFCSGSYLSGLCGGPTNRRCCVPGSTSCTGVNLVSRSAWGARAPTSSSVMSTPVSLVFIHHTAGSTCSDSSSCAAVVRQTQNYHMDSRGYNDIGYNFLVGGDGRIYEGRNWNKVGAHTTNYNSRAIAISFMGNFMQQSPSSAMQQAAQNLIACGVSQGQVSSSYRLYGHRQAGSTECPGDRLYTIIQGWPRYTSGVPA